MTVHGNADDVAARADALSEPRGLGGGSEIEEVDTFDANQ